MLIVPLALLLAGQPAPSASPPAGPVTPPATVLAAADLRDRLLDHLKTIPAKRAALGDEAERQGLVDTETWLKAGLDRLGLESTPQEFVWASPALKAVLSPKDAPEASPDAPASDDPRFRFRNHVVELRGTDLAHDVVILGAHYDAVPGSPGADDNASGVAALLEAGRLLKDEPRRRTVRLVFFTLEEVGLIGSVNYVLHKKPDWTPPAPDPTKPDHKPDQKSEPKERLIGMVSLECVGYFSDAAGSQKNPIPMIGGTPVVPLEVPDKGHQAFSRAFADAMRAAEPDLPILAADLLPIAPPDFLRSDHAPFLLAGLPAIMLTNTANFRNPNYHTPTDTVETLDLDRLSKATRAVAAAARTLANPVKVEASATK
jgi:hypothetical protein